MLEHFKRGDRQCYWWLCSYEKARETVEEETYLSKEDFIKIRHKQNMRTVYKHTGKDDDYEVYKEALNAATNEVRKSKRNVELKLAQHIKSDSKRFYAYVRS